MHDDPDFVKAALSTGAAGCVIKSHMAKDLIFAIREALARHRFRFRHPFQPRIPIFGRRAEKCGLLSAIGSESSHF